VYYQQNLTGQEPEMSITYGSVEYNQIMYEIGYHGDDVGRNIKVVSIQEIQHPQTKININSDVGKEIVRKFKTEFRLKVPRCFDDYDYDSSGHPISGRARERENLKRS